MAGNLCSMVRPHSKKRSHTQFVAGLAARPPIETSPISLGGIRAPCLPVKVRRHRPRLAASHPPPARARLAAACSPREVEAARGGWAQSGAGASTGRRWRVQFWEASCSRLSLWLSASCSGVGALPGSASKGSSEEFIKQTSEFGKRVSGVQRLRRRAALRLRAWLREDGRGGPLRTSSLR